MPHVLKGDDLARDLLLRQLYTLYVLVLVMVRAVETSVDTVIRQIEWREHNYAITVERELYLLRETVHLLIQLRYVAR